MTIPTLLPADHVRLLHPTGRRGSATMATQAETWVEKVVSISDLPAYAAAMRGATDVFLSQQSFWGWRRIARLAQLGAVYSDIDYQNTEWSRYSPDAVAYAVLAVLEEARIPAPSYILSTGRGILASWLHDLVPRSALPRWMAVQKRLLDVLRPFGADPKAIDAARVFRLAGTRHSMADAIVRPVWVLSEPSRLWRWSFDDLANEILPRARADLFPVRTRPVEKHVRVQTTKPAAHLTIATYWEAVLSDLQRLLECRWFGTLPPGQRDTWLFLAGVAMSWVTPRFALSRELNALASEVGGWTTAECNSRLSSVISRTAQAARGQTQNWHGQTVDPRYRFKAATIVEWLDIQPDEMHQADLRVLINKDVKRERAAERQTATRRRRGAQSRAAYEASAISRRQAVAELRNRGLTIRAVAAELRISPSEVQRLI